MHSDKSPPPSDFPVDLILPQLLEHLTGHDVVILEAPPGAGKTTRVPPALLALPELAGQTILMLEPRRLAAVNAAGFMARQYGEEIGATVGYTIRYERRVSEATRIEVVTEGVLTRRLLNDPELTGVGLVIFDEFHERNLQSDLALALCRDAQTGLRPDLKLVIMSATLETERLSSLLEDAPVVSSRGRMHPVEVSYAELDPTVKTLLPAVTATVARALREVDGDLLVFLPGAAEIRRAVDLLSRAHQELDFCPLYGGLPLDAQRRAIEPGQRRKVVVATNVAETSLTIEGVRGVVDSGLEKRPRFDAARGLTTLETVRISRASARQRLGRAGRLGPGRCYRLWSEGVHGSLLPQAPAEITQADLAPLALDLAHWGVVDVDSLVWIDPPPSGHLKAARVLLQQLGALNDAQQLTAIGRQLAEIPVHPRFGRLLLQARESRCPELGADLVALLDEGLAAGKVNDLVAGLQMIGRRSEGMAAVERSARYWRNWLHCGRKPAHADVAGVARLLAVAFPDRIARARAGDPLQYLLANGMAAGLDPDSPLRGSEYLIAVDLHGRTRADVRIRLAIPLDADDFEQLFGAGLKWERQVEWDGGRSRVVAQEIRCHGALVLQSRSVKILPEDSRAALLGWVKKKGLEVLAWNRDSLQLRDRLHFVSSLAEVQGWPGFSEPALLDDLAGWLGPFLDGVRSVERLRRIDLKQALLSRLDWAQRRELDSLAPERIKVPGGSNVRIDYSGEQPVLAVKLQELFGLAETPRIAAGRVPVLIHLLSPAGRPLQVTTDLNSFWVNGYPEVKKEMKGRYPRHPWPDDPWSAMATRKTKRRL